MSKVNFGPRSVNVTGKRDYACHENTTENKLVINISMLRTIVITRNIDKSFSFFKGGKSIILNTSRIYPLLAHLSRRLKGELIVYRSIRHPCVRPSVRASVNIFKLEYLRNQWANRNQILSEASLGWGIDCIRFWTR